jgi:hypothetical protein
VAFAGLILAYLAFINETNHSEGLHVAGAEFIVSMVRSGPSAALGAMAHFWAGSSASR